MTGWRCSEASAVPVVLETEITSGKERKIFSILVPILMDSVIEVSGSMTVEAII